MVKKKLKTKAKPKTRRKPARAKVTPKPKPKGNGGNGRNGRTVKKAERKNEPKLSDDAKEYVMDALAKFTKPRDIIKHLEEEFKVKVERTAIQYYRSHRRKEVEERRDQYMNDVAASPLAHLRYRLNRIEYVLDKAMEAGRLDIVLDCMRASREEVALIQEGLLASGTKKEAVDFLSAIGFGSIDTKRVRGNPRSKDHN